MFRLRLILMATLWVAALHGQAALELQGDAVKVLSNETEGLDGILTRPLFSPFPAQIFSFERISGGLSHLHIYDFAAKSLYEIRTVFPEAGVKHSVEDSLRLADIHHSQLSWRPFPDEQGRYWFTFVSNGIENNPDIYLGFAGSTTYIRLTTDAAVDETPQWSPDGNRIAFISRRSGNGDIYIIEEVQRIIADQNRNVDNFRLRQLTRTPLEERDICWNPDPAADLLAFARLTHFEGREVPTFQIRILDLTVKSGEIYEVSNDPLTNYTRPSWNPNTGAQLLFVGEGLLAETGASLYLEELARDNKGRLHNTSLEGLMSEVFANVHLAGTHALWLAGGKAILCQENRPEQNYPLYSVNIERRLEKKERAIYYFGRLHSSYPYILDYDARKNNFLFVNQEANVFTIYLAQIYGDDIVPYEIPEFSLVNPSSEGQESRSAMIITDEAVIPAETGVTRTKSNRGYMRYLLYGGAAAVGATVYLIVSGGDDGNKPGPIGLPPSMP